MCDGDNLSLFILSVCVTPRLCAEDKRQRGISTRFITPTEDVSSTEINIS